MLPKSIWKCFKTGWDDTFLSKISKRTFYTVSRKYHKHATDSSSPQPPRSNIFPLLHQIGEEFPFKSHQESDSASQRLKRDEMIQLAFNERNRDKQSQQQNSENTEESNNMVSYESLISKEDSTIERIISLQHMIDDLLTDTELQIENFLQNPKLTFEWKQSTWQALMDHYLNYEKLRSNYVPGGFMIPYQKIYIQNHVNTPQEAKMEKLLKSSIPIAPSFLNDTLHLRSISMRLSYSDEFLKNNFVLPMVQLNKETLFIQVKGKTKFMLFDPFHNQMMEPQAKTLDWKIENDKVDGHIIYSSIDPFHLIENEKKSFLSDAIALTVELEQHEVLYVPTFWWVLEVGIHSKTEENINLMLRQEFETHHAMLNVFMNGLLRHVQDESKLLTVETQKRPVKLPSVDQ